MPTIEFEFDIGASVKVVGLEDAQGFVVSLWYASTGPQYEVAYYCDGERKKEYFFAPELKKVISRKNMGFKK